MTNDLISRNAIEHLVMTKSYDLGEPIQKRLMMHDVESLPSAQPECKDCKNWDESWTPSYSDGTSHYCPMIDLVTDEHFYCKYGDFK